MKAALPGLSAADRAEIDGHWGAALLGGDLLELRVEVAGPGGGTGREIAATVSEYDS